jgi:DNA-binding transcriptional regulator YdaS (Cro superfamily)
MNLKTYITKHGDQKKLAKKLKLHHVYFNALVNLRRTPSRKLALKIQKETGGQVTAAELLGV